MPYNLWFFFGISAIVMAACNLVSAFIFKRDPKWFRFCSLALTALTVCTFLIDIGHWVHRLDMGDVHIGRDLIDVVIPGSKIFMTATLASILINVTTLIPWKRKK